MPAGECRNGAQNNFAAFCVQIFMNVAGAGSDLSHEKVWDKK